MFCPYRWRFKKLCVWSPFALRVIIVCFTGKSFDQNLAVLLVSILSKSLNKMVVAAALPTVTDPFQGKRARRNTTESQQLSHARRPWSNIKMKEVGRSNVGKPRRMWSSSSQLLIAALRELSFRFILQKEGCDRGRECGRG